MVQWKELGKQRTLARELVQLSTTRVALGNVLKLSGPQHSPLLIGDGEE